MKTGAEIAIVGMNCRFPGAGNASEFWANIVSAKECIKLFDDNDLRRNGVSEALLKDRNYVKSGFVVPDIDQFDAEFFGLTPRDAQILDPQHRLFLECCWHALEHAGHVPERSAGRIGVYAGVFSSSYLLNLYSQPGLLESVGELAVRHGNEKDYLATRLSYKLDLRGPSVSVQTSCSTSLVAVHMAVQSLLAGECDMALAGGVSVSAAQESGYLYQAGGLTSPDGHCRPFDAAAGGTVFGNGLGVVVLKRLDDALADGDTIYAVIKGSAINNDGSDKVGFTAPSVNGQAEVIAEAMAMAEVDAGTIGLVEAHGTGTPLGDPIEVEALTRVWRSQTDRVGYCAIGSVKSNVGHLGAASGVAGLIKAALALHHKTLAPTVNFTAPNPNIAFAESPFYVNTSPGAWPDPVHHPRRAAVSSFGMGGTNAHVVLEEAPPGEAEAVAEPACEELIVLSARSASALQAAMAGLQRHLQDHPAQPLKDLAHTLRVGRRHFSHRAAFSADTVARAAAVLAGEGAQRPAMHEVLPEAAIAFLFPGQGSQYAGMCRGLYASQPVFRKHLDECRAVLARVSPEINPLRLVHGVNGDCGDADEANRTQLAQPALFAVEYALAQMLMAMGITPDAMLGHSVGEYVCATLAGVFSLEDALRLVAERGRLMQSAPPGRMVSVPLAESRLRRYVAAHEGLDIAAVNHPEQCVVAGPEEALAMLEAVLSQSGISTRYLQTSHAFHCSLMDPIVASFGQAVAATQRSAPTRPYLSNVTGEWITAEQAMSVAYWCDHLRRPVRFSDGVEKLLAHPGRLLVEVGPGTALTGLVRSQPSLVSEGRAIPVSRHPRDGASDQAALLEALGQLWAHGVALPERLDERPGGRRVALPLYPFEHKRFWIDRVWNAALPAVGAVVTGAPMDGAEKNPAPSSQRSGSGAAAGSASVPRALTYRWERRPAAAPAAVSESLPSGGWRWAGDLGGDVAAALRAAAPMPAADDDAVPAVAVIIATGGDAARLLASGVDHVLAGDARRPSRIAVVTQQAAHVDEPFALQPWQAGLLSAIYELIERHPEVAWLHLDLGVLPEDPASLRRMASCWANEVASHRTTACVAWRGGRRFVLGLQPGGADGERIAALDTGTALIAAPSPALALSIAAALHAAHGRRNMVLVLGAEAVSLDAVAKAEAGCAAQLAQLTAAGVVLGVQASAINPEALSAVIEQRRDVDVLLCQLPDGAMAEALLQAVERNPLFSRLDHVGCLVDQPLPLDAAVPSAMQVRWAAEAARLEATSMTTLGLVLGQGLAAQAGQVAALAGARGLWLLAPDANALGLQQPAESLAQSPAGLTTDAITAGSAATAAQRPKDVEAAVTEMWQSLFGMDAVKADDDFFALGGTSLVAIQMISQVRDRFGVELSIESLFDDPTVRGLAKQIRSLTQDQPEDGDEALAELLRLSGDILLDDLETALAK